MVGPEKKRFVAVLSDDGLQPRGLVVFRIWSVSGPGLPDGIHTFKANIQVWVNFGGSCNGRCWYILWLVGLFYSQLVYFTASWSILQPVGLFFGHLIIFYGHLVYFFRCGMLYQKNLRNLIEQFFVEPTNGWLTTIFATFVYLRTYVAT
jgi:hypothetical protein